MPRGNVRELVNVFDCEVSLRPPGEDVIDHVPETIQRSLRRSGAVAGEPTNLEDVERDACIRAPQRTGGNVARAASILGVAKATLYSKMRRYGIALPAKDVAPPLRYSSGSGKRST